MASSCSCACARCSSSTTQQGTLVESGVTSEEKNITWKLQNFGVLLKDESMMTSQKLEFTAGETVGLASKWKVFLGWVSNGIFSEKTLGLFFKMTEAPSAPCKKLFAQLSTEYYFDNRSYQIATDIKDMLSVCHAGFNKFIETGRNSKVRSLVGSLNVKIKLRLFSQPVQPKPLMDLEQHFQMESKAKAYNALQGILLKSLTDPQHQSPVKVVSSDAMEFSVNRLILEARCPTLESRIETDAQDFQIEDISGKTLQLFFQFLYTGELGPGWKESETVKELLLAAGRYKVNDLLRFFDDVLPDICTIYNVLALVTLANELSLKKAEGELRKYVAKKVSESKENLDEMVKGTQLNAEQLEELRRDGASASGSASGQWLDRLMKAMSFGLLSKGEEKEKDADAAAGTPKKRPHKEVEDGDGEGDEEEGAGGNDSKKAKVV